jgi:hypothetical protein
MAWGTISVSDERAAYDQAVWPGGSVGSSPVWLRCTAPDALSNLVAVLELAADRQLRYGAGTRRPLAATVRLVEDVLVAGDYYEAALAGTAEPIAAFAWPLLLQAGGLAQLAGARLELTGRGRAALAQPSYQTLGALWDRWLTSVSHDELARVEAIKGQRRPSTLTSVPLRRAAVAAGLTAVEPAAWTDVDVLLGVMATQPRPLVVARSLRALWRLYLTDAYHGSLGHAGPAAWNVLAARYALCVLFEYAATMGVIDVAYTGPAGARDDYRGLWGTSDLAWLSRYDGLVAVRVNELGAAILHDPGTLGGLRLPVPRREPGQAGQAGQ